jgi:cation diffusion facilitator CzcD-associated flavoprotein CzcO
MLILPFSLGGVFMLKTLRERGLKTVLFEAGNNLGGTWRWNCYPGAGVDSEVPQYKFSWPEVWKTWNWPNNYPNYANLRAYFAHVDKVLEIKKDCAFNTVVISARFDTESGKWHIRTEDGRVTKAKYLVLSTGFVSHTAYVKPIHCIETFGLLLCRLHDDIFLTGLAWTSIKV